MLICPTKFLTMPQIWEIYPLGRVVSVCDNPYDDRRDSDIIIRCDLVRPIFLIPMILSEAGGASLSWMRSN